MMSQEIFFDGNLKSSIVAQKPMSPVDWTYVSPGLYVQSQREVI